MSDPYDKREQSAAELATALRKNEIKQRIKEGFYPRVRSLMVNIVAVAAIGSVLSACTVSAAPTIGAITCMAILGLWFVFAHSHTSVPTWLRRELEAMASHHELVADEIKITEDTDPTRSDHMNKGGARDRLIATKLRELLKKIDG